MADYVKGLDILELFGFLYPTERVAPSFVSVCSFLRLPVPVNSYEKLAALKQIAERLLENLMSFSVSEQEQIALIVDKMYGWNWRGILLKVLPPVEGKFFSPLKNIGEWQEEPLPGPGSFLPLTDKEVEKGLSDCLHRLGRREKRQEQFEYAREAARIFAFPKGGEENEVNAVLAQAGTGIGKTLGYGVPVRLWTAKNDSCVWMSTYTKALQTQLLNELSPLFAPGEIVVRKGRENYLCLLNYMEAADAPSLSIPLGFTARWLMKTKDGDLRSGDFSSWIMDLFGRPVFLDLTDKRGECLYSACPYYKKCFIEKVVRACRQAKVVIANHALVMAQMVNALEEESPARHYVFDEGHHLFQSADSAFSLELSGREGLFMSQYIFGASRNTKHLKGLPRRVKELPDGMGTKAQDALFEVLEKAACLPKEGFMKRLQKSGPKGSWETFLQAVRRQVFSQNRVWDEFSIECPVYPATDEVLQTAEALAKDIKALIYALQRLLKALKEPLLAALPVSALTGKAPAATPDSSDAFSVSSVSSVPPASAVGPDSLSASSVSFVSSVSSAGDFAIPVTSSVPSVSVMASDASAVSSDSSVSSVSSVSSAAGDFASLSSEVTETMLPSSLSKGSASARAKASEQPSLPAQTERPDMPEKTEKEADFQKNKKEIAAGQNKAFVKESFQTPEEAAQAARQLEPFEKSIKQRLLDPLKGFAEMLASLTDEPEVTFVEWFEITKREKEEVDVMFARHFFDPMKPLYDVINEKALGLLITSATLKENTREEEKDWERAEKMSGARYLPQPATRVAMKSPFRYREQAKIFLITDVDKNSPQAVANAFERLFKASGGGALGIFTAIHRLRRVYQMIEESLRRDGIELFAQHVTDMASSTLIDLFKADENACLLGTDTVRDGIDVPGRSLRLIVFERIPWPRPDILHKARRNLFEKGVYDKMTARQKLTQAFGRLIRNKEDRGAFVLLEAALPSELIAAFPEGVELRRVPLSEAVLQIEKECETL